MEQWREELYQSGIKGQKWGTRHGPPYPLDASDYTAKQRKENPKLYAKLKKKEEILKTQKPPTNARIKKNIEREQLETQYLRASMEKRRAMDEEAKYEMEKKLGEAKMKNEYRKATKGAAYDEGVRKANDFLATTASVLAISTSTVALISAIKKLKQKSANTSQKAS